MERLLTGSAPYLERKGGLRQSEYFLYNFPYACAYACGICCNQNRQEPEEQLSSAKLNDLTIEAAGLGLRVFGSMGLGEPLITEGFEPIVRQAHREGLTPYIFTTAYDLDKRTAEMLAENGASLIVHIDTLDEAKYHEMCRGKSNLSIVLRNLEYAQQLFCTSEKLGDAKATRIAVNMVAHQQNISDANELYQFCEENGFVFVINTLLDTSAPGFLPEEDTQKRFPVRTVPLGTSKDDICEYLKRGVTIQGKWLRVCPYSDTKVAEIGKKGLEPILNTGWKYASDFFVKHGAARCLVRHPNYRNTKQK